MTRTAYPHSLKLVWALTVCLVAVAAASAGTNAILYRWLAAEHDVTVSTNNQFAEINARFSRIVGILEDEGLSR